MFKEFIKIDGIDCVIFYGKIYEKNEYKSFLDISEELYKNNPCFYIEYENIKEIENNQYGSFIEKDIMGCYYFKSIIYLENINYPSEYSTQINTPLYSDSINLRKKLFEIHLTKHIHILNSEFNQKINFESYIEYLNNFLEDNFYHK